MIKIPFTDSEQKRIEILQKAHQEYVDWWLPIDSPSGSLLDAMSFYRFLQFLLTGSNDDFFDRWIMNKIDKDKKGVMKQFILDLLFKMNFDKQNFINVQE